MTETASLVIKVDSSGASKATRDLDKLERAALGNERAASKVGKAWGVAIGLLSSAVIVGATRTFIRQADAFANMSARIGLVTKNGAELVKVQRQLFELSQATSSDLQSTTDLYVKLAQSSDDLRGNQALLLRTTELVSKSLVVSGTEAAGAAAVIRQFSQAMGAGALRGDEFISIMENAPRLARAIADGMGVAVGELRDLAKDGKLTSDVIVAAIESQGEAIDREFGKMPLTVGRATQQVKNALGQMIGETDKAEGASRDLAVSIEDLARALESDSVKNGFGAILGFIADLSTASAIAIGKMSELWAKAQQFATFAAGGTNDVADLAQIRFELEQLEGVSGRKASKRRKELQGMEDMSLMLFGDPSQTPVTMITGSSGSIRDEDRRRASSGLGGSTGEGEEDKAAKALQKAYEGLSASLREQLALHGLVGEAAKVRYAVEHGELSGLAAAKKAELIGYADELDAKEKLAAIEEAWADAAQEARDRQYEKDEAIRKGQAATDQLISDLEFELSLMGLSNIEREKAIALRYADAAATDEQRHKVGKLAEALSKARDAQRFIDDIRGAATEFASAALSGFGSVGESFERMVDRMKRAAADMLADKAIQWLISAFFGKAATPGGEEAQGGLVDLYSGDGFGFAKGGVPNADLSKYSGSIVDKPTFFANGGNVMGEAGPEGIFPLKRGPDGKLGVVAMGGGGGVNIEFNVTNTSSAEVSKPEVSMDSFGRILVNMAVSEVDRRILGGKSTGKAISQRFGLANAGTARGF